MGKYVYRPLEVEGFKITAVDKDDLGYEVFLENGDSKYASPEMCARMIPAVGDYWVRQLDGYEYLNPKDVFEKKFIPADEKCKNVSIPNKLTQSDIDRIISASIIEDVKFEPTKTTLVKVTLPNGFEIIESSSCVDSANYDHEIGKQICMERIVNKIWMLEGYVLSSKRARLI